MIKQPLKQVLNSPHRDETASVVASIFGLSARAVRMVISGETSNDKVMEAVMMYKEGKADLIQKIKSKLLPEGKSSSHSHSNQFHS
jgi:hypothetical protein